METEDEKLLEAIRKRDADYGDEMPGHWIAQCDRRTLLRLLDEAMLELEVTLQRNGIGW